MRSLSVLVAISVTCASIAVAPPAVASPAGGGQAPHLARRRRSPGTVPSLRLPRRVFPGRISILLVPRSCLPGIPETDHLFHRA